MANNRYVNTYFWDDGYIEDLCPMGKLLFIYLITTPLTNIAGSFEITLKKMHGHTGIDRDMIGDLLKRFEADGKVIYRDRWMLLVNTIEHQNWETHATIRTGIVKIILASPAWVLDRVCIAYEWLSYLRESNSIEQKQEVAAHAASDTAPPRETSDTAQTADDPVERRIWCDGVEMLVRAGMTEASARPLLGRWAKDHTRINLALAIAATQAANSPDPKGHIGGVLKGLKKGRAAMYVGQSEHEADEGVSVVRSADATCGECLGSRRIVRPAEDGEQGVDGLVLDDCRVCSTTESAMAAGPSGPFADCGYRTTALSE